MHLNMSSPLQVSDGGDPLPNDTQTHWLPEGSTPPGGPMTSPGLSCLTDVLWPQPPQSSEWGQVPLGRPCPSLLQ